MTKSYVIHIQLKIHCFTPPAIWMLVVGDFSTKSQAKNWKKQFSKGELHELAKAKYAILELTAESQNPEFFLRELNEEVAHYCQLAEFPPNY